MRQNASPTPPRRKVQLVSAAERERQAQAPGGSNRVGFNPEVRREEYVASAPVADKKKEPFIPWWKKRKLKQTGFKGKGKAAGTWQGQGKRM